MFRKGWGAGLGFLEPTDDWFNAEMFVPEGQFDLVWRAFASGWGVLPSVILDRVEFIPEAGPASPLDDASGTGSSLANGIDNGDFVLSTETSVELAYSDTDFLNPEFQTGLIHALIGGKITTSIESALAHLAAVGSPGFFSHTGRGRGNGRNGHDRRGRCARIAGASGDRPDAVPVGLRGRP